MGLAEVLPRYVPLKRRIAQTAQAVVGAQPDVLITVDSPDFCLRVVRKVKAVRDIRTVHYVAPTVWAWRPGRAVRMAQVIDHVLALFPFEPPYMTAAGMECDFVGHPAATAPQATDADCAAFRAQHGVEDASPLVLALPGSRRGEVRRMGPVFGVALARLAQRHPRMRVVLPAAGAVAELVAADVKNWPVAPIVIDPRDLGTEASGQKRAAFRVADLALATSGTVALELAAAGTPMVSAYDMHWLSRAIISRMVTIDTGNLVNLVSETRVVPEVIGKALTVANTLGAMERVLADPTSQAAAMALTMDRLGRGGEDPGLRAARAVLERMG